MPSLSGALSPTPRKMNRAAHFSPRPMVGFFILNKTGLKLLLQNESGLLPVAT